jgi:putative chitinase
MTARQQPDSGPDRGHDRNPPAAFAKYGTTSLLVIAHAMAEFWEEFNAGLEMVEDMNYSAARLLMVFPGSIAPFAR